MSGTQIPSKCDRNGQPGEDCGPNPFVVLADKCEYMDQQTLKLQESPEVVPTGEMPRNIMLSVDRGVWHPRYMFLIEYTPVTCRRIVLQISDGQHGP